MSAFLFLIGIFENLEREHRERIREANRKIANQSWKNFQTGLQQAEETAEKLFLLSRFGQQLENIQLPTQIKKALDSLCEEIGEYATDLDRAKQSSKQASRFATEQTLIRNRFAPRFFQRGSFGERFHEGSKRRFEKSCQGLVSLIQKHLGDNNLTDDELVFIGLFREFVIQVQQTMENLR